MATATRTKTNTALRDEWLQNISVIADQIGDWVRLEPEWSFEREGTREAEEDLIGKYPVTLWRILTPEGEIRLEPIARNYPGRGIIELYAWPTAYRVRLIQDENNGWRVLTDSGIYLRQPWDRDHFIMLVRELIGAEDMIPVG